MSVQLTDPINFPSGDRRTVQVRHLAAVAVALPDPLFDPARDGSLWVAPLDVAVQEARRTLARYEAASIHDHGGMVSAATGLDSALRRLVAALDAEVQA
ncbi:hypothetical protein [Streptomyces sp. NPDC048445]|uniref:hypothetical protein n=1 Tax=Streptomyces sp. NPDC048445 TaxID=3365553 RepID=UPI00371A35D2